jgi:flagellar basal-body rod modification protein FlgD
MPVTPISNAAATGANANDSTPSLPVQTLGQNDFLKLLATQMTSQDPLNPQSDTNFIAQMAQFTTLEQTKDLSAQMGQLASDQQLSQAAALLGRSVTLQPDTGAAVQGVVSAVHLESGIPQLEVGGALYSLGQVISIQPAPSTVTPTP